MTSNQGNKYILVLYEYDTNTILTEGINNRTTHIILRAYKELVMYLFNRGFQPKIHCLDNKASNELKQYNYTANKSSSNCYPLSCTYAM